MKLALRLYVVFAILLTLVPEQSLASLRFLDEIGCNKAARAFVNPQFKKQAHVRGIFDWRDFIKVYVGEARRAQKTIKVSTFFLGTDDQAMQSLASLLLAARAGRKVQLILDSGYGMGDPAFLKLLLENKNIDIKIYNPIPSAKGLFSNPYKWIKEVRAYNRQMGLDPGDVLRANYRLHDKLWIMDESRVLMGSSNLRGYGNGPEVVERIERDYLVTGGVTADINKYYDELWGSNLLMDARQLDNIMKVSQDDVAAASKRMDEIIKQTKEVPDHYNFRNAGHEIDGGARFIKDAPDALRKKITVGTAAEVLMEMANAKKSITISAPYFIVTKELKALMQEKLRQGIKIRVITNSARSMDYAGPQIAYERTKKELTKMGVEIYEYEGALKLHAKTIVIDDYKTLIGTYNIDPRTQNLNRELVMQVESASFASETLEDFSEIIMRSTKIDETNWNPQKVNNTTFMEWVKATFFRSQL